MKFILNVLFIMLVIGLLFSIFGLCGCFKKPEEIRINEEMVNKCTVEMLNDSNLVCD